MNAERVKAAREALDNMDDYARMNTGVDAIGPRKVLEDFITEAERATQPAQDQVAAVRAVPEKRPEDFGCMLDYANYISRVRSAAWDVIHRWDSPLWRSESTADFIKSLRDAVSVAPAPSPQPELSGSIDGPEFNNLLCDLADSGPKGVRAYHAARKALVAHINQWKDSACARVADGAFEAGRKTARDLLNIQGESLMAATQRATDAEAKLAAIREETDTLLSDALETFDAIPHQDHEVAHRIRAFLAQRTSTPSQGDTSGLPG